MGLLNTLYDKKHGSYYTNNKLTNKHNKHTNKQLIIIIIIITNISLIVRIISIIIHCSAPLNEQEILGMPTMY